MQAELKVIGGKQQGKIIPLTMKKFLIGREKDCHLRPNNDLISRHHCVLTVDEFTVRVRDLGSTNGTLVNSERIQGQVVLNDGDQLAIGKLAFEIRIRDAEVAANTETVSTNALDETNAFTSRPTPIPETIPTDSPTVTTEVTAAEISIPVESTPPPVEGTGSGVYGGDTVMIPAQTSAETPPEQPQAPPQPAAPQQAAAPQQQAPPVPGMPQGQFMQPPQQFPQFQMPPQQYPPQQFPQYQYPPQQYPPQQFMQQPMPMMPQPVQMAPQPYPTEVPGSAPPQPPAAESAPQEELDVRLPPPAETGAHVVENQAGSTGAPKAGAGDEVDPRSAAADIIRQYTQRPPGE